MTEYLLRHPLVLAAVITAAAGVLLLLIATYTHWRYLALLRRQGPRFWQDCFGSDGLGLVRLLRVDPAKVQAVTDDPIVLELSRRFARPFTIFRMAGMGLMVVTGVLLVLSGVLSRR